MREVNGVSLNSQDPRYSVCRLSVLSPLAVNWRNGQVCTELYIRSLAQRKLVRKRSFDGRGVIHLYLAGMLNNPLPSISHAGVTSLLGAQGSLFQEEDQVLANLSRHMLRRTTCEMCLIVSLPDPDHAFSSFLSTGSEHAWSVESHGYLTRR